VVCLVAAAGALLGALWAVNVIPSSDPFVGGDCGTVSAWASNQDSSCNEPLLDRATAATALVAVAALLVLEVALAGRVQGRPSSSRVRMTSMAIAAVVPAIALAWVATISSDTASPSVAVALGSLALVVATLAFVQLAASTDRVAQLSIVVLALAGAVVLFSYGVMLWGGNGA
jgi:hypothetical protein